MRGGALPVAALYALCVAAALWAARPFQALPDVVPATGPRAVAAGLGVAVAAVALLAAVAALFVWTVRRDLDRALRQLLGAAVAFGLLLLLVPLVLAAPLPPAAAWAAGAAAAIGAAWLLRRPRWPAWTASALAAGGYAGMAGGVAGLTVLSIATAAVALYDLWAVRRASMRRLADASDRLALPLTVGEARAGLSLGVGDLALPAALVAAAAGHGPAALAGSLAGAAAGLALVAAAVRRRDVPGIPYLCGATLAGVAAGLLLARLP